jgi:hypothetical protein
MECVFCGGRQATCIGFDRFRPALGRGATPSSSSSLLLSATSAPASSASLDSLGADCFCFPFPALISFFGAAGPCCTSTSESATSMSPSEDSTVHDLCGFSVLLASLLVVSLLVAFAQSWAAKPRLPRTPRRYYRLTQPVHREPYWLIQGQTVSVSPSPN